MKQKVVIKVSLSGEKTRVKAFKVVVGVQGVESVALQGQEKNQIEVIGNDMDAATLTAQLRKSLGSAELVSVSPVEAKKDDKSGGGSGDKTKAPEPLLAYPYNYYPSFVPSHYYPTFEVGKNEPVYFM